MKLNDGQGEMFCDIGLGEGTQSGLSEEDLALSLSTLERVANECNADVAVLRKKTGDVGVVAECLVRRRVVEDDFMEVRYVHTCVHTYVHMYVRTCRVVPLIVDSLK